VLEFFHQSQQFAQRALANENAACKMPVCSRLIIKSDFYPHKLYLQEGGKKISLSFSARHFYFIFHVRDYF